ncbi:hypothetical protein CWB41_03805 [Methylovirgula ligni]|nr:hypothetical protein CWB41_03805 [Methylovirgula ligni]
MVLGADAGVIAGKAFGTWDRSHFLARAIKTAGKQKNQRRHRRFAHHAGRELVRPCVENAAFVFDLTIFSYPMPNYIESDDSFIQGFP